MNPDQFKQMVEFSKKNPTSPYAQEFQKRIQSGAYNDTLSSFGIEAAKFSAPQPKEEEDPGFSQRVKKDFQERRAKLDEINLSDQSTGSKILQHAGQVAGGVGDIILEGIKVLTPQPVEKAVKGVIEKGVGKAMENPDIANVAMKIQEWAKAHPEAAGNLEALINIAGIIPEGKAVDVAATAAKKGAKEVVNIADDAATITKNILKNDEAGMKEYIQNKFIKGVRPSVSGKGTAGAMESAKDKAFEAVKTIVQNKKNLNIINDIGEPTGKLPRTLRQFIQAIDQTKKFIYNQYHKLTEMAGAKGVEVDLSDISTELSKVGNDIVLQDTNPSVAKYALQKAETLMKRSKYTPQQVEDAIAMYNKSLEAFYKNPTYETASKAAIDSMIVNNLRKGLDTMIEKAEGKGYQALKNKYGALKSIEKDVVHRAIVDARKNVKGLPDYIDAFSAEHVIRGISQLDPSQFTIGAAQSAIKSFYNYLNGPNRAIRQMFQETENLLNKDFKKQFVPKSGTGKLLKGKNK